MMATRTMVVHRAQNAAASFTSESMTALRPAPEDLRDSEVVVKACAHRVRSGWGEAWMPGQEFIEVPSRLAGVVEERTQTSLQHPAGAKTLMRL